MHPTGFISQTNPEYHSGPGASKSQLDLIARSPAHYWAAYRDPNRVKPEPTPALILGSAVHSAVLEPDLFGGEYTCAPEDAPKRPTAAQVNAKRPSQETADAIAFWRDFEADNAGKTLLTRDQWTTALAMRDAVHRHPLARRLVVGGQAEQSVYATNAGTGALIKCRLDYFLPEAGMIVDLKTTEDASPAGFGRSAANFRYHVQCGWYQHVMAAAFGDAPPYWVFLAVEKSPPYAVGVYHVDAETAALGLRMAMRDLRTLVACEQADTWPDYGSESQPLQLPGWYVRQQEGV